MTVHRRQLLGLATSAAVISTFTTPVWGQTFPSRPIRWLSGFAAGGPGDVIQRVVAQFLHERLGQPVVIDRQPGASGTLALQTIARSAPDGYSLSWLVSADAINVTLRPSARSNVVRDIAPIAALAQVPNVLAVIPSLPVKTVPEFIAYAKANPGKIESRKRGGRDRSPRHRRIVQDDDRGRHRPGSIRRYHACSCRHAWWARGCDVRQHAKRPAAYQRR